MNTATYLDTSHPAPRFLPPGRALAGRVAVVAAAIARASLRAVAAAANHNHRLRAAAHLTRLDPHLVRDLGFNHRVELLLVREPAGASAAAGSDGWANDNGAERPRRVA
jgi:hypothetical protein